MTFYYYPDTDNLYIELKPGPGVETVEIRDGLNVDLDAGGEVVGCDMDRASRQLDLSRMEPASLPLSQAGARGVAGGEDT